MSSRTLVAPPRADNSLRAEFGGRVRAIAFVATARVDAFHVSTLESARSLYLSFGLATLREDQARDGERQSGDDGHGVWLAQQDDRGGRRDGGDKVDLRRRDHGAEPAHRRVPGYEARRGGD